jgi:hypothetical protein
MERRGCRFLGKLTEPNGFVSPTYRHWALLRSASISGASPEAGGAAATLCRDLIGAAAPPNPRALKRVLNALLLTLYLDGHDDAILNSLQNQSDKDRARRLAKLVLLQVCFDETWRTLVTGACSIKDAEKFVLGSDM